MPIQFVRTLGTIFLLAGMTHTASAQLLQKGFETVYEVHHNSIYLGDTTRKLSRLQNGQWQYGSHTQAKGFASMFVKDKIVESSKLDITLNGVKPYEYLYDQSGGKRIRNFKLEFLWDKKILNNTYLKEQLELPAGTQDLLSFVLEIMVQLQNNKETLEMHIADKKRVDNYQLQVIGTETIETPYKSLPTIVTLSNKIKDRMQFKIWCAPSLQYLPIKIMKIEDDGDEDVMSLKELITN